jgi:AcrR family transcriptional regulator
MEHGLQISTRQIAQAAGVAEGTIFRVFPTKQDLITEVILEAVAPDPAIAEIAALPAGLPLQAHVQNLMDVLVRRMTVNNRFIPLIHSPAMRTGAGRCAGAALRDGRYLVAAAVAESLTPYVDDLRVPPHRAAAILDANVFTTVTLAVGNDAPSTGDMASLLLYGIADKEQR